ncbi:glycosyl transferase [Aphelenchoides avenae]|nr:glycosyl transferase [Aphelenchus avenae]
MSLLVVGAFFSLLCAGAALFLRSRQRPKTIAFFHPYCNAAGGGERVLWCAIKAMRERFKDEDFQFCVYTGDTDATPADILAKAHKCFGVSLDPEELHFVYIRYRWLLEARYYPFFTLLLQSLGSMLVGLEALWKLTPSIYVDTTGAAFTYPLFRWFGGANVVCYVHYPTITKDMLALVKSNTASYNNARWIASNPLISTAKVFYYRLFALVYSLCGRCAHVVMANGTWTARHLRDLWNSEPATVFPPCDVKAFASIYNDGAEKALKEGTVHVVSVGQIRPEKNHRMQMDSLAILKRKLAGRVQVKLHIAGGCRNVEDETRVDDLRAYAEKLDLYEDVEFHLNLPFPDLLKLMERCLIGIHTMWNEHFGISVVEGLAAGLIMVAHKSGGPLLDIVGGHKDGKLETSPCGFLADNAEGRDYSLARHYAEAMREVIEDLSEQDREAIRRDAQFHVCTFSEENFGRAWNEAFESVTH